MSIQVIKQGNKPEWAVVPYETYLHLVESAEMLQDIQDYDSSKAALERGEMETIPSEVVYAILDGENPLKVWREFRGISQQELAERAEISIPYVSQLETNKRKGSLEVLSSISRVLNVALEDIIIEAESLQKKETTNKDLEDIRSSSINYLPKLPRYEILLEKGATQRGREELATQYRIDERKILEWVNRADLYRIKGIGSEYSDLLEAVGVNSIISLSNNQAELLWEKIVEVNIKKKLVRRIPTLKMVMEWISEAKKIPHIIDPTQY
jgi:transcriptional regulator with XRE-family HTH domain